MSDSKDQGLLKLPLLRLVRISGSVCDRVKEFPRNIFSCIVFGSKTNRFKHLVKHCNVDRIHITQNEI